MFKDKPADRLSPRCHPCFSPGSWIFCQSGTTSIAADLFPLYSLFISDFRISTYHCQQSLTKPFLLLIPLLYGSETHNRTRSEESEASECMWRVSELLFCCFRLEELNFLLFCAKMQNLSSNIFPIWVTNCSLHESSTSLYYVCVLVESGLINEKFCRWRRRLVEKM